ncbi:ATP-binding protein [Lysobacter sp. TY2-98]|uniref:sensor histidine kinase n=1 Tax=Lysobacter sp. TY2-98 TaxID=2290922 RepID=UPI001F087CAC|nr:ATP-binding protein [Lysobacter sp. TY2-98]
MPFKPALTPLDADHVLYRELRLFNLYRVLEAALLVALVFGPTTGFLDPPRYALLARSVVITYLFVSLVMLGLGRRIDVRLSAGIGVAADLFFGILAMHALPSAGSGIAVMILFNVGAASLLLPSRFAFAFAMVSIALLFAEYAWGVIDGAPRRSFTEPVMFAIGYAALATVMNVLGRQMRDSYEIAALRTTENEHLAQVNELIIRRLRTGVLLVDGMGRMRLANEAATALVGDVGDELHGFRELALAVPELGRRLAHWRASNAVDETPMRVAADQPDVIPRFARLQANSDQALVFLDDTSLLSQHAESITLATLGRFSASLAHEIRNPLAAMSYAVQLLEESDDIRPADRRLLEIIHQHIVRMNGIVENVLGLARREPAKPVVIELVHFAGQFVDDYLVSHPIESDTLISASTQPEINALFDPRQLHQAVTVLVANALNYGRMPGEPARVTVRAAMDGGQPVLDVIDRGPGIPEPIRHRLFKPFFTTSSHGTGLGLYIARELCRANQASLDYVPTPGVGGCFRIRMSALGR